MEKIIVNIGYFNEVNGATNLVDNRHPNAQIKYLLYKLKLGDREFNTNQQLILSYLTLIIKSSMIGHVTEEFFFKEPMGVEIRQYNFFMSDDYVVIENYEGLPPDENILNDKLTEMNTRFSELLDIEDKQK